MTLPAPLHVETDTGTVGFDVDSGQFGLTMRWVTGTDTEEADDESGGGAATAAERSN